MQLDAATVAAAAPCAHHAAAVAAAAGYGQPPVGVFVWAHL